MILCVWCSLELDPEGPVFRRPTRDHLIPRSKKGTNHRENLAPACHDCNNKRKSTGVVAFVRRMRNEGREPNVAYLLSTLVALSERKEVPKHVRQKARGQVHGLESMDGRKSREGSTAP